MSDGSRAPRAHFWVGLALFGLALACSRLVEERRDVGTTAQPEPPLPPLAVAAGALAGPSVSRAAEACRIAFVGDVSVSMQLANELLLDEEQPAGFPFQHVAADLDDYALLAGNLECVMSFRAEPEKPRPLSCPESAAPLLRQAGFDYLSLANNHAMDRGRRGYLETAQKLAASGIASSGHSRDEGEDPVYSINVCGTKLAIVAHHNRQTEQALADVARARATAEVVVVYVHWGVDYDQRETAWQRRHGRRLLNAGADFVVGGHPHVVQREERLGEKWITHSLGNFIFPGMTRPGTDTGALLEVELGGGRVLGHRYRVVEIDAAGIPRLGGVRERL